MSTLLFVYGTLKRGYRFHDEFLGQAQWVGDAVTVPRYRLYDCGEYPAMVMDLARGCAVRGEVFRVPEHLWPALDDLEDVDAGLYVREIVPLAEPFASETVWGYRFLLSVADFADLGAEWPAR